MQFENIQRQTDQGKMAGLLASRKWEFEIRSGYDHQKHKWKKEALRDSCMTRNGSERWQEKQKDMKALRLIWVNMINKI